MLAVFKSSKKKKSSRKCLKYGIPVPCQFKNAILIECLIKLIILSIFNLIYYTYILVNNETYYQEA